MGYCTVASTKYPVSTGPNKSDSERQKIKQEAISQSMHWLHMALT
jgi:hypothetical protein